MNFAAPLCIMLNLVSGAPEAGIDGQHMMEQGRSAPVENVSPMAFTPVKKVSDETGTLEISVYPETATVVLNEFTIGNGNQLIESLPAGYYNLFVSNGDTYVEKEVQVQPQAITNVHFSLERKTKVVFEPKYSAVLMHGYYAYGPQIGAGVKLKNNLLMLDFNYNVEVNIKSTLESALIGGALKWSYCFAVTRYLTVAPGISAGRWRSKAEVWGTNGEKSDWHEGLYYGGPHMKTMFFNGAIRLSVEYSLLLGTGIAHIAGIGATIVF
jgi:hypothetical protein